ncbi:MAG: hypothetical protein Salg2KO_19000 [Salibacteraceae bacterium]
MAELPFRQKRLNCYFDKGKLFYLEYNFRLLLYLWRTPFDVVCAIDLDTALPAVITARLKSKPWVFDAHEYFSEMHEIVTRPIIHKVWKWVERFVVKKAAYAYTISDGYARMYLEEYGQTFLVVKNVPVLKPLPDGIVKTNTIIYQGALNEGRGLPESVEAMKVLDDLQLNIYGDGPLRLALEDAAAELRETVRLHGSIAPQKLRELTPSAWCGLTLFSDRGRHHRHSLANRFFDYIHAGVPQIAMNYPEYKRFNERFEVAVLIEELTPSAIVDAVKQLKTNQALYNRLVQNCQRARLEVNWQKEEKTLIDLYNRIPL